MREMNLVKVVDAAIGLLDRTVAALDAVTDEQYTAGCDPCDGATIGQHVRHVADHFESLAIGFERGTAVDYDRRDRGTPLESSRAAARDKLTALRGHIAGLDEVQLAMPVMVRVLPEAGGSEVELESTYAREIAFVAHHALHHHAIIKTIGRSCGVDFGDGFGRAPSTIEADQG